MLGRGLQLKTLNVSYVQHPCSLINGKKKCQIQTFRVLVSTLREVASLKRRPMCNTRSRRKGNSSNFLGGVTVNEK